MTHLPVLPILIPLIAGALLILLYDLPLWLQRVISIASTLSLLGLALALGSRVGEAGHLVYALGSWAPPFGIVLVPDRLSVLMLTLTAVLALFAVIYASRNDDEAGAHFHALFQFQLMGLNGAFLTGDLFNLFVFFEVLLIASYALLLHGGGPARSRAGLHYVILNLIGSALFIIAVGILYGVTGTLNMADLAVRISEAPPADLPLIQAASLIFLVVFGVKAALLPLLFWLPRAYTVAAAPVAALFAIMTKVGVYAMLRVFPLVFALNTPLVDTLAWQWLWPLALATLVLGGIGVLGATSLRNMTAYMVIVSAGTLMATLALGSSQAIAAGLFYLVHSTLMTAAFFLFADLIARQRGEAGDHMVVTSAMKDRRTLGILFFLGAIAFAGLPPFSGFISKIWILESSLAEGASGSLWPILLGAGLLMLIALSRAGSKFFWRQSGERPHELRADRVRFGVVCVMLLTSVALSIQAQPLMDYLSATAASLQDPGQYVETVMNTTRSLKEAH
ncbi:multisubunit potassium/proton antiporter PhaD subunit [Halospina denitrificans]|uniref:Multisubunit potassium/proton antiporter PhaD subunit n=1 Tax=Halospina denitrificans TaxID=332522 RepID=A0A4R7JGX8_9GAMM|nr:monovalent cation/H+ antiporter subunit D [Halospina denitrificans]TDT37072.1 multisubunit potassium/proton antiporter PhaD subunit [Halospina denitrificans]